MRPTSHNPALLPNHDLATQHFLQAFLPYAVFFHVHGIRSTTRDFLKYAVLQACGITNISSMQYYKHAVLQACGITSTDCRDYKHAVLQACSITSMWYYKHVVLQAQTVGITSMQYYKHAVLQVPTMGISSTIITLFKRHSRVCSEMLACPLSNQMKTSPARMYLFIYLFSCWIRVRWSEFGDWGW